MFTNTGLHVNRDSYPGSSGEEKTLYLPWAVPVICRCSSQLSLSVMFLNQPRSHLGSSHERYNLFHYIQKRRFCIYAQLRYAHAHIDSRSAHLRFSKKWSGRSRTGQSAAAAPVYRYWFLVTEMNSSSHARLCTSLSTTSKSMVNF